MIAIKWVATMWVAKCAPVERAQRGPTGSESCLGGTYRYPAGSESGFSEARHGG